MQFLGLNQIIAAHFAKQNTNPVVAKSGGAAEGGRSGSDKPSGSKRCGGNSAAPERSAGAKRRRSVPFKKCSSGVVSWCIYCTKLEPISKIGE